VSISSSAFVAAIALASAASNAYAQDDAVARGMKQFSACAACHSVEHANGVGPYLNGIVGRRAGSVDGFHYSRAMKGAGTWSPARLDAFIAEPQHAVPGTVMPYAGLPDAKARADLLAYLATVK
jgi:cytochrome c